MLYVENSKEFSHTHTQPLMVNKFTKVAEYRINTQIMLYFYMLVMRNLRSRLRKQFYLK